MLDSEVTAPADSGDSPPVAVLDPSVVVTRSRRSLLRVMITSPMLARFPPAPPHWHVPIEAAISGRDG